MVHFYHISRDFLLYDILHLTRLSGAFGKLYTSINLLKIESSFSRCFPHVINLACKAVLKEVTDMKFAAAYAQDYVPSGPPPTNFLDVLNRDPIATVRTLVRVVSISHTCSVSQLNYYVDRFELRLCGGSTSLMFFGHWIRKTCSSFEIWMSGGLRLCL